MYSRLVIPRACRNAVAGLARFVRGLVWAFLAVALAASPARAVPFDWGGRDWEGCAELVDLARSELGPQRVVVTSRLDLHALEPTDGVVIIHPQKRSTSRATRDFFAPEGASSSSTTTEPATRS